MPDDKQQHPSPLIKVTDLLGLSEAGKRLVEAIVHGVGEWAYPWQRARTARADVDAFQQWARAFRAEGLPITAAELSLEQRTVLRVSAQEIRHQQNREAIAAQAAEEFQHARLDQPAGEIPSLDIGWPDRFGD